MKSTQLEIGISHRDFEKDPKRARTFNGNSHVCAYYFEHNLGSSRRIDDLIKLNIDCGRADADGKTYWKAMGYAHFQFRPVNLRRYAWMTLSRKQRFTLALIRDALLELANNIPLDTEAIHTAYQRCMDLDFPLDPTYLDRMLASLNPK